MPEGLGGAAAHPSLAGCASRRTGCIGPAEHLPSIGQRGRMATPVEAGQAHEIGIEGCGCSFAGTDVHLCETAHPRAWPTTH